MVLFANSFPAAVGAVLGNDAAFVAAGALTAAAEADGGTAVMRATTFFFGDGTGNAVSGAALTTFALLVLAGVLA